MGIEIDNFDIPVCNSFEPKILKDQLCYQVNLNKFKSKVNVFEKVSFSIFIDYNEDRQLFSHEKEDKNIDPLEWLKSKKSDLELFSADFAI